MEVIRRNRVAVISGICLGLFVSTDTFAEDENSKESTYGTNNVPAGETNRALFSDTNNASRLDRLPKPVHPFARILKDQGLIQDTVRGTTSSSARRETPSNVFGISTPGKVDPRYSKQDKLGATNNLKNWEVLKFRDEAFMRYFTNPEYIDRMVSKFGDSFKQEMNRMLAITLPRKIVEENAS